MCVFTTGNIGYGKIASQSGDKYGLSADLALDGIGYGIGDDGLDRCAYTDGPSLFTSAFWTVDLGRRHQILNVTIYNRGSKFSFKAFEW